MNLRIAKVCSNALDRLLQFAASSLGYGLEEAVNLFDVARGERDFGASDHGFDDRQVSFLDLQRAHDQRRSEDHQPYDLAREAVIKFGVALAAGAPGQYFVAKLARGSEHVGS